MSSLSTVLVLLSSANSLGDRWRAVAYRYHTELMSLEENTFGRTGAHDTKAIAALSDRFNQLSADGWKLFHIAEVLATMTTLREHC